MDTLDLNLSRLRTLAGACLIGAPLFMLISDTIVLLVQLQGGQPSGAIFWIQSLSMWLSFDLFVGAVVTMAALAASRAPVLAGAGAILGVTGSLIGATIMGLLRMAHSMKLQGVGMETVQATIMDPAVHFTSRAPGLTFPLGLIVLAGALGRVGVLSRTMAVTLAVGAVLFPVGRIITGPVANVPGDLLMAVAMVPLGIRVTKTS